MEKLFIKSDSPFNKECSFHLVVVNTGEILATHFCSRRIFAYGDLYGNSTELQQKIKEKFGEVKIITGFDNLIEFNEFEKRFLKARMEKYNY